MPELSLRFEHHVSPARFAETGRLRGAYRSANGAWGAVTSELDHLYWPGRALYEGHRVRHRTAVYSGDFLRRIAIFDGARFPINDVAFHPSKPLLAIATGSYDGGFFFEGDLWLWNWETNASWRVFCENREVRCVRFDGDELVVLLRPRDEEALGTAAFETYFGGSIIDLRSFTELGLEERADDPRIAALSLVEPGALGFDVEFKSPEQIRQQWDDVVKGFAFEPRGRIWDIAWLDATTLVAVDDGCLAEQWSLSGKQLCRLSGEGHGVQVFRHENRCFVHGLAEQARSTLYELANFELRALVALERAVLFSQDRRGRFLARDVGALRSEGLRRDCVVDTSGRVLSEGNFGDYDCFNHHLRIDGDDSLYFLRGTPATSHAKKVLCAIDASGRVAARWRWDTEPRRHLMCTTGCMTPEGTWIRSYYVHDPRPSQGQPRLDCRGADGSLLWQREISAPATSLVALSGGAWLIYALTDGTFGIVDRQSGEVLFEETLRFDGALSMILSLAERDGRVAAGTIEGRVLVGDIVAR